MKDYAIFTENGPKGLKHVFSHLDTLTASIDNFIEALSYENCKNRAYIESELSKKLCDLYFCMEE